MASADTTQGRAALLVTTDLPWLVRGWCRLLTRPYLCVDHVAHQVAWGSPKATRSIELEAGEHHVQFKVRFRGTQGLGAASRPMMVQLDACESIQLLAAVSAINGHPPSLREWAPES